MKLLFVTEFFPIDDSLIFTGGVESHNFHLFKKLAKKHKVTVICRWGSDQKVQKKSWGMKIIRIGKKQKRIDTNFSTIPDRFLFIFQSFIAGLNEDFDLIQGNNFVSYPSAFLLGLVKRKPAIIFYADVFIGNWIPLVGFFSGLIGEITERIYLILPWRKIISLSKSTTDKLINQKIEPRKIKTIHGGVDFNYFSKFKLKKDRVFTICCVARLVSYKRIDLLLNAAAILKKRKVNSKIEIIGSGPEDFSLKLLAQNLGLDQQVRFRTNISREELAKTLSSSHLFCLPSQQEGFGLVVMEAASSKLPYVISNINVFKEITNNGQGGLFFKKGDAKDLANKINRLIKDSKLYQKLSKQAFDLAQEYRWDYMAKQFEEEYKQILRKPKKILMLVDAWFPHVGGGQIHAWELAKQIAGKGDKVIIFTRDLGKWDQKFEGVKVIRVGHFKEFANIFGRVEYLILALFYSLSAPYDIWHAHAFSPGLLTPIVKFFRQEPTVFTVHGSGMQIAGLGISGKWLEDLVFYGMLYEAEITVARKTLIKKTKSKRMVIIPNGVNINEWVVARRERKQVGHILYVGRVVYDKGVDLLMEAFKQTKGLKLAVVGEGQELEKLKKRNHDQKIRFTGKLEGKKLIDEFKKADLLVMPSRVEGMPLRLLEAWAARLPVVATRAGDNEIYIKDGINGFLTEVNTSSIFEGIERARKLNLTDISDHGWKDVQKFSWENIAQKTLKVYQEVLDEKTQG